MPVRPSGVRRWDVVYVAAIAGLVILAVLTVPLSQRPLSLLPDVLEVFLVSSTVTALATAAILTAVTLVSEQPRKSTMIVIVAYANASILSAVFLTAMPFGPGLHSLVNFGPNVASYIYIVRDLMVPVAAIGFALFRSRADDLTNRRGWIRFAIPSFVIGLLTGLSLLLLVLAFADHFPRLVDASSKYAIYQHSLFPYLSLGTCLAAIIATLRIPDGGRLERFLLLTIIAIAVDLFLVSISGQRYTVGWYMGRFSYFWSSLYVLTGSLTELIKRYGDFSRLERSLHQHVARADGDERRIMALRKIALDAVRPRRDVVQSILESGARSLRPGASFSAILFRIEGQLLVTVNTFPTDLPAMSSDATIADYPLVESILTSGSVAQAPYVSSSACEPWHAAIGTDIRVGSQRFVVVFGADVSIDAFAAQDVAFVEVLARILASQLEGRDVRAKLQHAIEHDALTGLLNRAAFRSRVVRAVASGTGMVAMIDIDHFRDVNRDLGQIGGDSLLVEFGAALEGERRDGEVVARLGDDKFGVLIPEDFDRDGEVDVFARLMSFARAIDRPFSLGGRNTRDELQVNARIGVARFPQDGRDVETIFARALGAVEGAHGGGRPRIEFFDPRLETEFAERRKLLSDLRNAIDARHFVVHYQPTLDLVRRRIIGAEALVRWSDPVRGLIPPDRFIGPAHDAGLLSRITELVLDTVVEDLPMLAQGRPSFRVYVNFTMDQLRESDLIDRAVHRLGERKLPASLLGIEITESMAMEDIDATLTALRGVRARGIRVALDDFGTGYSSLSHLKNLPVDMVKIDRSFVAGLPDEDRDCALVESFLTICRTFEFTSLAEGIESAQTEAWLAERGCNAGQGYLFARPLARPDLLAWMEGRAAGLA